jgi:hypothetical protein
MHDFICLLRIIWYLVKCIMCPPKRTLFTNHNHWTLRTFSLFLNDYYIYAGWYNFSRNAILFSASTKILVNGRPGDITREAFTKGSLGANTRSVNRVSTEWIPLCIGRLSKSLMLLPQGGFRHGIEGSFSTWLAGGAGWRGRWFNLSPARAGCLGLHCVATTLGICMHAWLCRSDAAHLLSPGLRSPCSATATKLPSGCDRWSMRRHGTCTVPFHKRCPSGATAMGWSCR